MYERRNIIRIISNAAITVTDKIYLTPVIFSLKLMA